ncbi:MAG TPA: HAD-IA family hydrolase [Nitrospiraceae bacterium]|nr:HAD-IA family hydrolase [Nitrospiraceae bacterium]
MKTPIQLILFDAAETLFHVNGSVAEIYLRYAVKQGFQQKPDSLEAITQSFKRAFREAPPPAFVEMVPAKLKQCERLWWFDIVHSVFYRVGMFERFDEFFEEVFRVFEDARSWVLYPETERVLAQLRDQGFELGIVSNFDSRLFTILRGLGIESYFNSVTISSLAQAAKPAARIFELAVEKHAMDPEEAVHIGDSLRDDVEGAQKAGLTGILLDRKRVVRDSSVLVIHALDELLSLVTRSQ